MTAADGLQLAVYLGVLLLCVKPLGLYMARVYSGAPCGLDRVLGWCERGIYRLARVNPEEEMPWQTYAVAMLLWGVSLPICQNALWPNCGKNRSLLNPPPPTAGRTGDRLPTGDQMRPGC